MYFLLYFTALNMAAFQQNRAPPLQRSWWSPEEQDGLTVQRKPLLALPQLSNIPAPRNYSKSNRGLPAAVGGLLLGAQLQFPKEKDLSVR